VRLKYRRRWGGVRVGIGVGVCNKGGNVGSVTKHVALRVDGDPTGEETPSPSSPPNPSPKGGREEGGGAPRARAALEVPQPTRARAPASSRTANATHPRRAPWVARHPDHMNWSRLRPPCPPWRESGRGGRGGRDRVGYRWPPSIRVHPGPSNYRKGRETALPSIAPNHAHIPPKRFKYFPHLTYNKKKDHIEWVNT